jgi:hypothetical protein
MPEQMRLDFIETIPAKQTLARTPGQQLSRRCEIPPFYDESSIYATVAHLQIGEMLPEQVFISDYADGFIPRWQLAERDGCMYTLIDVDTLHSAHYAERCYVGVDVVFLPTRCLCGRHYTWFPGCVHARHMFGDVRQEARKIAERMASKKQGTFVSKQHERRES